MKVEVGPQFSRCRADCDDDNREPLESPEVFEIACGSGSSVELLPEVDDLRLENDKQTPELHETIWSDFAEDETLPEIYEIVEDETSPEIYEVAGSGVERAANLLPKTMATE